MVAQKEQMRDRIKSALVKEGLLTAEQLEAAEQESRQAGEDLETALVRLEYLTADQLAEFIGEQLDVPYVNIEDYAIDTAVLTLIPEKIARRYNILPLFKIENNLTVAMADPLNIVALDDIKALTRCKVDAVFSLEQSIKTGIDQWYGMGEGRKHLIERLAEDLKEIERKQQPRYPERPDDLHLVQEALKPSVVKLINSIIAQAILENASDIHLEPKPDSMLIRFRIDGLLYNRQTLPLELIKKVTSRIKIMSGMDISIRMVPQDGRIGLYIRNRHIDIRTSTFPSLNGENIVLRILDKSQGLRALSDVGLSDGDLKKFRKTLRATKGLMLATGPTGSGKTTTIYAVINSLNRENKNIMTIEDPVEYETDGIIQCSIDPKVGVTFPSALRSILRQDPDIIYVGEIRDTETAKVAVRASMTGHFVISTLHTNNAVSAITRLVDMGIAPVMLGPLVVCVFAQRLVRRLCQRCRKEVEPKPEDIERYQLPADVTLYDAKGCVQCNNIGYKGRIGVFEVITFDRDLQKMVLAGTPEHEIMATAVKQGTATLLQDAIEKVIAGVTTLDEVRRMVEEE